jgi:hypothetical protein
MEKWCVLINVQSNLKILKEKSDNLKALKIQRFAIATAKLIIIKIKFSMKESLKEDYNFKTLQNTLDN